ncbi:hypothetical protein [Sphingorhabdus sp. Alg231-15]|uniref:hypothetical protein n=1 Tax=Sphingorhabdus sp. Alg231-15 TaxID=1922222 RepID=UPI000D551656
MAGFLRFILGLFGGALITYIVGTTVNSQFVMNAHGVPVTWGDRLNMTLFDISNMLLYFVIIALSFLIAFAIAALLKRLLPNLANIAYPIAGAAAIGAALGLMYMMFQTVPISGARSTLGFLSQMAAGGLGGWIFGRFLVANQTHSSGASA